MAKSLKVLPIIFIIMVILAGLGLSGCSSGTGAQTSTPAVQQPSSSSTPSSSTPSSSTPSSSGNGQANTPSGQRGSRGSGGSNMTAVLNKAADILGISESTFTSAFNDAQKSVFGSQQPSGGSTPSGQPPQHPSGSENWSGQGRSGGQPPSGNGGGQQGASAMMTKVYAQNGNDFKYLGRSDFCRYATGATSYHGIR